MSDAITLFPTALDGIAAEIALLAAARPARLIWQAQARAIVMPWHFSRHPGFTAAAEECAVQGWPVMLRPTGGGAVPQGPGVLNLAMVWPAAPKLSIDDAYRGLCAPMIAACADFGLHAEPGATEGSFCDGTFNLSLAGRKIVGTAQRWRTVAARRIVLAHAMILIDPPAAGAIAAINALHDGLALNLPIRAEVHTGLSAHVPGLDAASFAAALEARGRAALSSLSAG